MSINIDHSNLGDITLRAPASGNVTIVLPSTVGTTGQVLTTDGTGNLSFATAAAAPDETARTLASLLGGNNVVYPRVNAAGVTTGNLQPIISTTDVFNALGLTDSVTVLAPSGVPVDGQRLLIRLEDNGTSRSISWTTTSGGYRALGTNLPTTTTANTPLYVGCVYNSTDIFWDVIATTE